MGNEESNSVSEDFGHGTKMNQGSKTYYLPIQVGPNGEIELPVPFNERLQMRPVRDKNSNEFSPVEVIAKSSQPNSCSNLSEAQDKQKSERDIVNVSKIPKSNHAPAEPSKVAFQPDISAKEGNRLVMHVNSVSQDGQKSVERAEIYVENLNVFTIADQPLDDQLVEDVKNFNEVKKILTKPNGIYKKKGLRLLNETIPGNPLVGKLFKDRVNLNFDFIHLAKSNLLARMIM